MHTSRLITMIASASALAIPSWASAASEYHNYGGEVGSVHYPGHVPAVRSRSDVLAELDAARRDGSLVPQQRGFTFAVKSAEQPRSRAQVQSELAAARQDGTLLPLQRGFPVPVKTPGR